MADAKTVAPPNQDDVVVDKAASSWSDLWKKEDYWAIWIAFALLILGSVIFFNNKPEGLNEKIAQANTVMEAEAARAPFKTLAYYEAQDIKGGLKGTSEPIAKTISKYTAKPKGWSNNPLDGLFLGQEAADARSAKAKAAYEQAKATTVAAKADAKMAEEAAVAAGFQDERLNQDAKEKIGAWRAAKAKESSAKSKASVKPYNVLYTLPVLMIFIGLVFAVGIKGMGKDTAGFLKGFVFVFAIAAISYLLAGQATMKQYGVEYAVFAIAIGMLISNTVGTPKWVKPALETEFYIKTGLVLLGAGVLFNKIVAIGIPGIFVAWVVTPIVLICTFIFGQKVLKMPSRTLNMVISADMSVCGTSAAIATAAACRAKKEELTLAIGLSLVFTAIMMVALPAVIKATGMPYILGGAWMGGTIDATGAVAAAGAFLSQEALYVAATIKMIQNVLIGVTAFGVAIYWCYKVDCVPGQKVSPWEIWHRFPKFVLGFLAASVTFSTIYGSLGTDTAFSIIDHGVLRGFSSHFQGWFFCLAFVSIGLATNFRELAHYFKGGKPVILYVCGQTFNLILTLVMAYIMFYVVFPDITAKI